MYGMEQLHKKREQLDHHGYDFKERTIWHYYRNNIWSCILDPATIGLGTNV